MSEALPREMKAYTYPILYRLEDKHWWYVGRRRIITSFVEEICRKVESGRPHMLDVGCGTGANLEMLARFGDVEGVDVSPDALSFCRERGFKNVKQGVIEKLPFDDGSFDLVTALDVIEHLDDDAAGLSEMRRVLKPGGRILLTVPAFMFLWGVQDDVSHHRRRYTLPELKSVVEKVGFRIERATYANISFFAPTLAGRLLMRATGTKVESEANINIAALNGLFGRILGAERFFLRRMNLPFGVSALCIARKDSGGSV